MPDDDLCCFCLTMDPYFDDYDLDWDSPYNAFEMELYEQFGDLMPFLWRPAWWWHEDD